MELCNQSISKEQLFTRFNLAVLFSCCCLIGKGEQYYIHQGGVIRRRVKFPPAKQEHITVYKNYHSSRGVSPAELPRRI